MLAIIGIPIAYLVVLLSLAIRKARRGIGWSLLFATIAAMTGFWTMSQSRSSTAALGILVLPLIASLAGFLALVFGRYRNSTDRTHRIAAWLALAGAVVVIGFNINAGLKTRTKEHGRDEVQAAFTAEIARNRESIKAGLSANPGRERAWLDSSIRARMTDRAFLLAALPRDSISPDILDSLASSPDLGIALESVRNPGTRAETLERVYRTKSYPDYFVQALAAHRNTPPTILREIYARPQTITGLDIWFAGNPSTPREILDKISRTSTDRSVIGVLLENPSLDCKLLGQLGVNLMRVQHRDADDPNVVRVSYLLPTVCPQKTPQ